MSTIESTVIRRTDESAPPPPRSIEETQLEFGFLSDLALKTVYADTNCTTERVADKLKMPMALVTSLLQGLYRERFIEARGLQGYGNNQYALLDHGWQRVKRLLDLNGYIGPAPVSLRAYREMFHHQTDVEEEVTPQAIRSAMSGLVLPEAALQTLGLVASSRRCLFMTGPSGNGKTTIAKALHNARSGEIWVPYAIEVDGQIIKVFDPHNHEPLPLQPGISYDQRWVKVKRPLVIVGGEMTIETMDLIYNTAVRFYEAPFQLKCNGGTLIIDDFGRQRVDPHDLLNRWIIPLEGRVDYLTLHTGKKIEVPFEQLLIFATNIDPKQLVDDAFLRRIGYRLFVTTPSREIYSRIFYKFAESKNFTCEANVLDFLFRCYERENRPLRGCEPRDLIERCVDMCDYESRPRIVTRELIGLAWKNYFASTPGD